MIATRSLIVAAVTTLIASAMVGCASPAQRAAMESGAVMPARLSIGSNVRVSVSGGQDTSAVGAPAIADADLKAAIEASILKASLFESVRQDFADFDLVARIIEVQRPVAGFSFTVTLEIAWQLVRASDQKILFRKSIRSEHTTGALESFAGVTRLRMAIEGAAKKNIEVFLQEVSSTSQTSFRASSRSVTWSATSSPTMHANAE